MKNVNRILSTYSADLFGMCSALYELGGMVVMHDASGCNSTYGTHDEPRWYSMESMVYISALTEMEAVLGDDEKLLNDITEAARELQPKFIAVGGTPIPMMMGTDFKGIARVLEKRTGIPSFGFATNGMNTYEKGAGMALEAIAERFCTVEAAGGIKIKNGVNILGATPLDFSINGNVEKLREILTQGGYEVVSTFAMGNTLEDLSRAGQASVNLVISQTGLDAARMLKKRFGIPYVIGIPMGVRGTETLLEKLREAAELPAGADIDGKSPEARNPEAEAAPADVQTSVLLIGEGVFTASLYRYLKEERGFGGIEIICPLSGTDSELTEGLPVRITDEESVIREAVNRAGLVIADPIYRRLLDGNTVTEFVEIPHEAFSGRLYHDRRKVFVGENISAVIPESR